MPRGGARVGSGRKPGTKTGVVIGLDGRRKDPEPLKDRAAADGVDLTVPPPGLSVEQRKFWRQHAPDAIKRGTLVAATVRGFMELCEQYAIKSAVVKKIQKLGPASDEADAYLRQYVKLAQRVDSSLARFGLTALGKPVDPDSSGRRAAGASPWAGVAR